MSTPESTYKNRKLFDEAQYVVDEKEYLNIESVVLLGYGRPSTTAKPLARSVFRRNASSGISSKWVPVVSLVIYDFSTILIPSSVSSYNS